MRAPVRVPRGMGSKVKKGQRPSPPTPLPPAPTWRAAGGRMGVATFADKLSAVEVLWHPEPSASQYLVQLSLDPLGQEVHQAALAGADVQGAQLRDLEPGVWWLRVASINDDAFEGPPSVPAELAVVPLEVVDPLGEAWRNPERPEQPPAWVWSGSQIKAPRGATCRREGSSAPPSPALTLSSPGQARILCTSASGVEVTPFLTQVRQVKGEILTAELPEVLPRGQRFPIPLRLPEGVVPYLEVSTSPGVISWPLRQEGDAWFLDVLIKEDAPSPLELSLVSRATVLREEDAAPLSSLRRDVDLTTEQQVLQQTTGPDGEPLVADPAPELRWSLELVLGGGLHLLPTGLGFEAEPNSQINPGLRLGLEMGRHFGVEAEVRGGAWTASGLEPGASGELAGLVGLRAAALLHLGGERWRPFLSLGRSTDWLLGTPEGYQGSNSVSGTQAGVGLKWLASPRLLWRVDLRQSLTQGRVDTLGTATEGSISVGWRW
jgi:hypothetical protein